MSNSNLVASVFRVCSCVSDNRLQLCCMWLTQDEGVLAAVEECERVGALAGVVPLADIHKITVLFTSFGCMDSFAIAYCRAIEQVCRQPGAQATNRETCGEAVLAKVAPLLSYFRNVPEVAVAAVTCVYVLCWANSSLQLTACEGGVVSFILLAMTASPNDSNLQAGGCRLLSLMVALPQGKKDIVAGGGARLLKAARAAHRTTSNVQLFAKEVLDALA